MPLVAPGDKEKPSEPTYEHSQQYTQRVYKLPHGFPCIQPPYMNGRHKHREKNDNQQEHDGYEFLIKVLVGFSEFSFDNVCRL